jgi:DNA polymerase III epsilon subunit-like protein
MSGIHYYIIDLETTGLSSIYHEITEVSIIRCVDKVQLSEMVRCDHPERASYDALRITGKSIEDLKNGISKAEIIEKIDRFLQKDGVTRAHRCFVGHNAIAFDKKFLHQLYSIYNKQCPVDLWMDTMLMVKHFIKERGIKTKVNLHASCDLLGIKKYSTAHSAKSDTRNTYLLWKNLLEVQNMNHLPFIKTAVHDLVLNTSDLHLAEIE